MNWPKICFKNQRYESFYRCFGAKTIICWSEFPDIPENWWSKRKNKGKEETNKKKKEILNFQILWCKLCVRS